MHHNIDYMHKKDHKDNLTFFIFKFIFVCEKQNMRFLCTWGTSSVQSTIECICWKGDQQQLWTWKSKVQVQN